MRAFTIFKLKLYPIQHAEGRKKRLKEVVNFISKKMEQLVGIHCFTTLYYLVEERSRVCNQ
jgi:hypothetical protein